MRPDLLLGGLLVVAALPTPAATTCTGSDLSMSLGNYLSYSATPVDASATLLVTCTRIGGAPDTPVTVGFGPSAGSGGIAERAAVRVGGSDRLVYNLYRDAARLGVWGDTPGVDTVTQVVHLANKTTDTLTFVIFSRIEPQQDVRAGSYADQLLLTIDY